MRASHAPRSQIVRREARLQRTKRDPTLAALDLDRQLRWLRAYALVTYPFACVPFLFVYFQSHGMGAAEYGAILTTYYAVMFVAEVPTGMLADRLGPRFMLTLGPLVLASGFATLLIAPSLPGFIVGEALLGLGHSVLSGPPTVALYEGLRAEGKQTRYLVEESRMHALRLFGTGAAFLLGGLLVHLGDADGTAYGLAIAATCGLHVLAALAAQRLQPLTPSRPRGPEPEALLRTAVRELRHPGVRWLLVYWLVLFTLLRFPFHDYQPYLDAVAEIEPWFGNAIVVGLVFAVLNLFAAPLSTRVPQLVRRWGRPALFWSMPVVLCVSMLLMAGERQLAATGHGAPIWCWLGVSMFFVQQVPFAMHWSLIHEFVNHRISSRARTTVLSLLSLSARAVYALANFALFTLQDSAGLATALLAAGACGLVVTFAVLWWRPRGLLRGRAPIDEHA